MSLKDQINSEIEKLNARGGDHGERLEYLDSELNIATGDNEGDAEITLDGVDTTVHVSPHPASHDRFEVVAGSDDTEERTTVSCHGFIGAVLFAQGMLQDYKREQVKADSEGEQASSYFRVMQDENHIGWFDSIEDACDCIENKRHEYPDCCTLYCDQHQDNERVKTLFTRPGCRSEEAQITDNCMLLRM